MRIQVNLKEDVVEVLDKLARKMGISRSGLCALYITMGLDRDLFVLSYEEKKEP